MPVAGAGGITGGGGTGAGGVVLEGGCVVGGALGEDVPTPVPGVSGEEVIFVVEPQPTVTISANRDRRGKNLERLNTH